MATETTGLLGASSSSSSSSSASNARRRSTSGGGGSGVLSAGSHILRDTLCGKKSLTLDDVIEGGDQEDSVNALRDSLDGGMGSDAVREVLKELWVVALGGALATPPPISPTWQVLGFQGSDPTRDLRSSTFPLALRLAVHALRTSPPLRREALLSATGSAPPFALAWLNTVHMLACHLKLLPSPPSFCPCCGASIREKEYGRLATQSHRGGALRGLVEVVREAGGGAIRGSSGSGSGSGSGTTPLVPPGELALGELVGLVVVRLGQDWRRQGREGHVGGESEESLVAKIQQVGGTGGGVGDTRLMGFPAMLTAASAKAMGALAAVAQGGGGGGFKRSRSEVSPAYTPPSEFTRLQGANKGSSVSASPLHTAVAAAAALGGGRESQGKGGEEGGGYIWGGEARKALKAIASL